MIDQVRMSWTQPCCIDCYLDVYPGREPVRMKVPDLAEICVYCGEKTGSGIYVRIDPAVAPFPTLFKE
jgi:hypothetical protein